MNLGVPDKMVNVIKGLIVGSKADIRVKGEIVGSFNLDRGLKQGRVFAPLLFNLFNGAMIDAWRSRLDGRGITLLFRIGGDIFDVDTLKDKARLRSMTLAEMLYADDAALVGSSPEELQVMMTIFNEVCVAFGQIIAIPKCVCVTTLKKGEKELSVPLRIVVNDEVIKVDSKFTYLGRTEGEDGKLEVEFNSRCAKFGAAFAIYDKRVFSNRMVYLHVKIMFFNAVCVVLCVVVG